MNSKSYAAEYYRARRDKFKALGLCTDCGGVKEPQRQKFSKCESCASKVRERRKKYVNENAVNKPTSKARWIDIDDMVYPRNSAKEVLVTDKKKEVFLVWKKKEDSWEDFFDDNTSLIAWMYLPKPFEKKVRL